MHFRPGQFDLHSMDFSPESVLQADFGAIIRKYYNFVPRIRIQIKKILEGNFFHYLEEMKQELVGIFNKV